jgi:hypothetical protein
MSMDIEQIMAFGGLASCLVDPNSKLGLQLEGATARKQGRARCENPFSEERYRGCLAEAYWSEGWDIADRALTQQGRG